MARQAIPSLHPSGIRRSRTNRSEMVKFPDDVSQAQAAKLYDEMFGRFTKGYSRRQFNSVGNTRVDDDGTVNLDFGYRDLDTGYEGPLGIRPRN
jgi:hypothetical protein